MVWEMQKSRPKKEECTCLTLNADMLQIMIPKLPNAQTCPPYADPVTTETIDMRKPMDPCLLMLRSCRSEELPSCQAAELCQEKSTRIKHVGIAIRHSKRRILFYTAGSRNGLKGVGIG